MESETMEIKCAYFKAHWHYDIIRLNYDGLQRTQLWVKRQRITELSDSWFRGLKID